MAKKLVYGVGKCEAGKYAAAIGRKSTKEYSLWISMLQRCYSTRYLVRKPTYVGCSVSDEFKDFQQFAAWVNLQIGYGLEGYQLDKDLLVRGNKVYSAETCALVPGEVNNLLISCGAKRGMCPVGVYRRNSKYRAQCSKGTRTPTQLGTFSTPEEAFQCYKVAKEAHIKSVANEYRDQLDHRAYTALMSYEILITD